jgi:hypothetical protein
MGSRRPERDTRQNAVRRPQIDRISLEKKPQATIEVRCTVMKLCQVEFLRLPAFSPSGSGWMP